MKYIAVRNVDVYQPGDDITNAGYDKSTLDRLVEKRIARREQGEPEPPPQPLPPAPVAERDRELETLTMIELRRLADEVGADTARTKAELIANIRGVEE